MVFPSAVGTPINPNNLARGYLQLVQKAGVPRIHIHDTRHTHVTLAVLAGAQLVAVSKRVGHAWTSTTADLYAHVLPEMHAEVATRINTVRATFATPHVLNSARPGSGWTGSDPHTRYGASARLLQWVSGCSHPEGVSSHQDALKLHFASPSLPRAMACKS